MDISNVIADDNLGIVKEFFKHYGSGDIIGMRSVLHDEIEWHVPGHHPLAGVKKGVEEVIAYYKLLQKANFKAEVLILEANDKYVVDCHRGWASFGGHKLNMNWTLLYEIENSKIKKIQTFPGDQHSMDNFFWAAYELKDIPERLKTK